MKADRLTVSLDPGQGAKYRQDRRDLAQRLPASVPSWGRGELSLQSERRHSEKPHDEAQHAGWCGLALSLPCAGKISLSNVTHHQTESKYTDSYQAVFLFRRVFRYFPMGFILNAGKIFHPSDLSNRVFR